jgi:hypothetical protein
MWREWFGGDSEWRQELAEKTFAELERGRKVRKDEQAPRRK